jgi:two-component system sensor histidine kinase TctE
MVGALLSFGLTWYFGNLVHDRWLLDSAMTLATQLRIDTGRVSLELPQSAVEMFEWDSLDRIYEEVIAPSGGRLFGNATFPVTPRRLVLNEPYYYNGRINGADVRIVAISVPSPGDPSKSVTIQVAETRRKRQILILEIILTVVPVQAVILLLVGALVWVAVKSSLAGLDDLAVRIAQYQPDGLIPLEDLRDAPSEVKPLANAINELIRKMAEARGTQQRFIANASHQLRTPLATLQLQTERALREGDPTRQSQALNHALAAVKRMRHVTQQLLTLTRSDPSSSPLLPKTEIDLAKLARGELERWADAAIERKIDLGYDGPERGATIHGNLALLRELIGNLVDNAIRYGREGGVVTLGVRVSPVAIFVEDDGPGIAPTERERVLEPFYRSAQSQGDGCGLGLAIAKEIALRHGARLRIMEHSPSGTRVEVSFG